MMILVYKLSCNIFKTYYVLMCDDDADFIESEFIIIVLMLKDIVNALVIYFNYRLILKHAFCGSIAVTCIYI